MSCRTPTCLPVTGLELLWSGINGNPLRLPAFDWKPTGTSHSGMQNSGALRYRAVRNTAVPRLPPARRRRGGTCRLRRTRFGPVPVPSVGYAQLGGAA